jgi:hypothetical protein
MPRLRFLVTAALLAATPLIAQSGGGSAGGNNDLFGEQKESVPVAKFKEKGEGYLVEMRGNLTKGLEILREAREAKDALRLQCVNEKITAMKGVLRISEDAYISLQEALATKATERARYEFNKVRTSKNKMAELVSAAQNCVGAEAVYTGDSQVEVEIDPSIAQQDPYFGNPDFFYTPDDALPNGPPDGPGDEPPSARPPVVSVYAGTANP